MNHYNWQNHSTECNLHYMIYFVSKVLLFTVKFKNAGYQKKSTVIQMSSSLFATASSLSRRCPLREYALNTETAVDRTHLEETSPDLTIAPIMTEAD